MLTHSPEYYKYVEFRFPVLLSHKDHTSLIGFFNDQLSNDLFCDMKNQYFFKVKKPNNSAISTVENKKSEST